MFYLIGQTVGQLQRLQGTGGRGAWERGSNISLTTIFTIVPFYVGTYNKKFGIQLGNEVWRNSCVERVFIMYHYCYLSIFNTRARWGIMIPLLALFRVGYEMVGSQRGA